MFLCMTYPNINDFPTMEFDDMKTVNVKNSNNVMKYSKNGGIDDDYKIILLRAFFTHPLLLSFDDDI